VGSFTDPKSEQDKKEELLRMVKLLLVVALCAGTALGQRATGTLRGQVFDELGGVIVGATVVAVDAAGVEKTATTNQDGNYSISGLAPGKYTVRVNASGFAPFENADVAVVAGRGEPLNITVKVTIEQQKVTVSNDTVGLNTDPENNTGAVILKGADIEALPDDPDDLEAALQALAGPSAGPNGGQIFIDGFSGGRLPPKSSIREVRINSNPFSAEYDRMGFGRIEILTRPGTDKFRGSASFGFNDNSFNSRNPFSPDRPKYQSRQYGGNLSGPISKKKASFFVDFEKRDVDDIALINATVLDSNLNPVSHIQSFATPNRRTNFSPRIDYQLNPNNTLVARYSYTHFNRLTGVGGFSLESRAYDTGNTEHSIQLTETAVINKKIVNETRFQYEHQTTNNEADNTVPTINISDSFTSGGSQVGAAFNTQNRFELTNNTSFAEGNHGLKFGARVRYERLNDFSPNNFGGTWFFGGNCVITALTSCLGTSLQAYRTTLLGLQQGMTGAQIRAAGGGATQFTINSGDPLARVSQLDFGGFAQDDWKLRPNLTVNFGLRYENQNNISSNLNFAPRLGFAWSPKGPQPRTVVRGGFGVFYDRVSDNLTLNAQRLNGTTQQQFVVTDLAILSTFSVQPYTDPTMVVASVPSLAALTAFSTPISIYQLADNLRAPYTMQSVVSVEHQLPRNLKVTFSYINARTLHVLRTRPINAPLPGTFIPAIPGSGVRPLGNNNIFEYESNGRFNQNQFIVNVNAPLSRTSSLNAFYVFAKANSDSDGTGTLPANPFDFTGEYSRSGSDVRHRFVAFGNFRAKWGISLNPFVIVSSGRPFNITLGRRDLNGDTVFTERPAFATDLTKPGVVVTKWGAFDPNPTAGSVIIPRNYGTAPGSVTANLRISKSFGFGKETASTARGNGGSGRGGQGGGQGGGRGGAIGMGGMGGMGGGPRGGGGGGGFGGGGFGGGDSSRRYNLTVSLNFQNILNHANLGLPVGNLSSPFFGMSTATGGNFGGFGGGGGGGGGGGACGGACNRRIDAQVRFSF
jgi:hypothetical protein